MNILSDKPTQLHDALLDAGLDIYVHHSPALDVLCKSNALLQTLKGLYVSSKLDFFNLDAELIEYIKNSAESIKVVPTCHTCLTYEEFDDFCKEYIDDAEDVRIAYDVETTAAPFLLPKYKLAGFSLAADVHDGCYVVLDSIDYTNPDAEACMERLAQVLRSHRILVFNLQHEYIASLVTLNVNLAKESVSIDDAYAYALTLKTESFQPDGTFKLKVLCNRLLGTENWTALIDNYIKLAMEIAREPEYDYSIELGDKDYDYGQVEKLETLYALLEEYEYTREEVIGFVHKLKATYPDWQYQDTIPYNLIPSRMIMRYGCYDSCYLTELFRFFENWGEELEEKLSDSLNKPDVKAAYENCVQAQVMSGILTMNGIFVSEERDKEVYEKTITEVNKYYDKLWEVKSDTSGEIVLREFVKHDEKQRLAIEKKFVLPTYLEYFIPEGWEFISTTPSLYSFTCKPKSVEAKEQAENEWGLKPDKNGCYKLLQKHLLPFEELDDGHGFTIEQALEDVLDDYLKAMIEKHGSLAKEVFKPMSGPDALFDILNRDLAYAHFMSRVILFEHGNLPADKKVFAASKFLEEHNLYDFDKDPEPYIKMARTIRPKVLEYLQKQYSFKELYEKCVEHGIKSFASPIIAYIYEIFTSTGCTFNEPKYSAFEFICKLKVYRKYKRIISTFIAGSSGGYAVQSYVWNRSAYEDHLEIVSDAPIYDKDKNLLPPPEGVNPDDVSRVIFGAWYANTAETGRWKATTHNIPAGDYCKRRFKSRFPGGFIITNDMSQAEVRELAAVSHCEKLLETVKDPTIDIHKKTASLAFDVPYDEVTKAQRKQTKTGIFSIVYGREEKSLAQELFNGDNAAAKRLMDAIFRVYPEIREYLDDAWADLKKHGYLVTRLGAPIFVNPYTLEGNDKSEAAMRRQCQNFGIQGSASQHMCTGTMVNVQRMLDKFNLKSKVCSYIHDSLEIDTSPDEFDAVIKIMNYCFNELATKKYGLPTSSDTVVGLGMEETDIKRIEKWHYALSGDSEYVDALLRQLEMTYDVEIVTSELGEIEVDNSIDWCFIPRSEFKWKNETQKRKVEIKITPLA